MSRFQKIIVIIILASSILTPRQNPGCARLSTAHGGGFILFFLTAEQLPRKGVNANFIMFVLTGPGVEPSLPCQ